jgi:hypothetical protein
MPFLLRLRSPPSDLLNLACTSGGPRTHSAFNKCRIDKASQTLTYNKALVCADGVNAEVLLRLARNELLERAQQANRQVTALVDEECVFFSFLGVCRTRRIERKISGRLDGDIPFSRPRAVIITSMYVAHFPVP